MKKQYNILELQKMEEFKLFEIASFLHVSGYEKMKKQVLIYAILDAQQANKNNQ